ncbi:UDP-N-acetylmuramoyl-L-alanyl-D-glutamate--2,6-diaminopimelate ligase [Clostridiales bacterium COT073_COT-073]|nr:UDP-N-acetylmuramoyl-L-alanyl-D-glutamate--2,6-diaminopimelate ligase [Clostridiales bacterium COT073_COT-073]
MKLANLLEKVTTLAVKGNMETEITGIANDSRQVKKGFLFVAVKGYETDGHLFCEQAITNGAVAILLEDEKYWQDEWAIKNNVTLIRVADSRPVLAEVAAAFYGRPAERMKMVGITGTNGKTSTALLTYRILEETGHRAGVIGTISNFIHQKEIPAERTTPEAHQLQALLAEMAAEKVEAVMMEVSSHALDLHRVNGIPFKVAAFTNLSLDHLDFHKTMDHYLAAKSKLFQMTEVAVVNLDDPATGKLLQNHGCRQVLYYSLKDSAADLYADQIEHHLTGTSYWLHLTGQKYHIRLKTPGNFSVYNSLAAFGLAWQLGITPAEIAAVLENCSQVRGRFQTIALPTGATAIVDYAHTPDGLENVLKAIAEFKTNRVITVFGCGGDRDRSKRPLMAEIAEKYSDYTIITSDNPRTEDPQAIVMEIASGMRKRAYQIETDRKTAIEKALVLAKSGDVVLIAGKGHEDYQIIGKQKIHFDDAEIVEKWGNKGDSYSC